MAADFAMGYDSVKQLAKEIGDIHHDFAGMIQTLGNLVDSLDGQWVGTAHDEFVAAYKKLRPKLNTISSVMGNYETAIRKGSDRQFEVDNDLARRYKGIESNSQNSATNNQGNESNTISTVQVVVNNSVRETLDGIASTELNNNGEKYCRWFTDHYPGLTYEQITSKGYGWCDRFTSWVLGQMGIKLSAGGCDGQKSAFGSDFHNANGEYNPQIGDLVFLDYDHNGSYDHVAIYYEKDGKPCLLHGNWGGAVKVSWLDSDTGMGCKISEAIAGYGDVSSYATTHPLN